MRCSRFSRKRTLVIGGAAVLLLPLLAGAVLCAWLASPVRVPSFEETRAAFRSSESTVYDRRGEPLHAVRVRFDERKIEWIPLDALPRHLRDLTVRGEDRRFYSHRGIDWSAVVRATWGWVRGRPAGGASTISMQVAALLESRQHGHRTVLEKLAQIRAAHSLELHWSKPELLEAYLNLVPFRGELRGAASAARGLFGKDPHGLTDQEAAILVALLRAPNAGPRQAAARACALLEPAACSSITEVADVVLARPRGIPSTAEDAPHVAAILAKSHSGAERIDSTIDGALQRSVALIARTHLAPLAAQHARDAAVLVVDNASGDILAYVGNTGNAASARYVDGVRARRSAGSTLKPFLYAVALDRRLVTAQTLLDDAPLDIPLAQAVYSPEDYDHEFRGTVTVRTALASSLNIPAVQMLRLVGLDAFSAALTDSGFTLRRDSALYGYSMALGSPAVSLLELVNGYRTLARGGRWSPLRLGRDEAPAPERRAFSAGASFVIADILSDRESRATTFGLENALSTPYWSAAKTGTSRDMTDNWCIGFTAEYTVGVWVGNFSGEPMWNVTGITGAAPIWVDVMNELVRRAGVQATGAPPAPEEVRSVSSNGGREWYLFGTEPAHVAPETERASIPRILYPARGMVLAQDPEVAPGHERLELRAEPRSHLIRYVMDGASVGSAGDDVYWRLNRGRHTLQLQASDGAVLDAVSFLVR